MPQPQDRELPSNNEAEMAVLGAAIVQPLEIGPLLIDEHHLDPDDFYLRKHQLIWRAIMQIHGQGGQCDIVAIADLLEAQGKIDDAGGRLYLNSLIDQVTTTESAGYYAKLIKQKRALRDLVHAGTQLVELGLSGAGNAEAAIDQAADVVSSASARSGSRANAFRRLEKDGNPVPVVERTERMVRITWPIDSIYAEATGLKEHTDGRITGFVRIGAMLPDGQRRDIHWAAYNFTTLNTRNQWAKLLGTKIALPNWPEIMEAMCTIVCEHVIQGEPITRISADDDVLPAQHVLGPILIHNQPVALFGERGSAKSYLALLMAYLVAIGEGGKALGFTHKMQLKSPLYLDWEGDQQSLMWRVKMLARGMGLPSQMIQYRRCTRPLAEDAERIQVEMLREGSDFVIIDSLGPACGGDLNAPQPAMEFFKGLRSLGVTSLVLAHRAKHAVGPTSIFGSMFFEALMRSIWEVKLDQESEDALAYVALVHRKMNYGRRSRPMALEFEFAEDWTRVRRSTIAHVPSSISSLPLTDRVLMLMKDGQTTAKQLCSELEMGGEKIRATLCYLATKGKIVRLERGRYGLAEFKDEEDAMPDHGDASDMGYTRWTHEEDV